VTATLRRGAGGSAHPIVPAAARAGLEAALDRLAPTSRIRVPPGHARLAATSTTREATVAASYAGAMAELVAPLGVICLDSTHPAVKRAMAPHLVQALTQSRISSGSSIATSRRWAPRRDLGARWVRASLVMLEAGLGRDCLVADGATFVTRRSRERFRPRGPASALRRVAHAALSQCALRPVLESALLPTVAYLAGPASCATSAERPRCTSAWASTGSSRCRAGPACWWSLGSNACWDKFGVTLAELLEPAGALEARLVRSQLPKAAVEALTSIRTAVEAGYTQLVRAAEESTRRSRDRSRERGSRPVAGTEEVEKKLVQAPSSAGRRPSLASWAKARAAVLPNQKPQERVLTLAPFLPATDRPFCGNGRRGRAVVCPRLEGPS